MRCVQNILTELRQRGIRLRLDGEVIFYRPASAVPDELLERMRDRKAELLDVLRTHHEGAPPPSAIDELPGTTPAPRRGWIAEPARLTSGRWWWRTRRSTSADRAIRRRLKAGWINVRSLPRPWRMLIQERTRTITSDTFLSQPDAESLAVADVLALATRVYATPGRAVDANASDV